MTDFTYPPKDPELAGEPIRETGYGAYTGPIHRQQRPDGVRFAMRIAPHHLNGIDRMHGGMTMSLASLASKVIVPGLILPVGIVTALAGIPLFVTLIVLQRRFG